MADDDGTWEDFAAERLAALKPPSAAPRVLPPPRVLSSRRALIYPIYSKKTNPHNFVTASRIAELMGE